MTISNTSSHYPVMLNEVIFSLNIKKNGIYVDGTYGVGGYTNAILDQGAKHVVAIDQDPDAKKRSTATKKKYGPAFTFLHGNFKNLKNLLNDIGVDHVDGIVLDLGVSSPQLDEAERGFSFKKEGPLDMRMSQKGPDAAELVNNASEQDLATIFWRYGEERKSYKIARAIIAARDEIPLSTTTQLADIIKNTFSQKEKAKMKIHPATRCFQALRIYLNEELSSLESSLSQSINILNDKGRLLVVTFHSLEDRIVKRFIKEQSGQKASTMPKDLQKNISTFKAITKKPILPTEEECAENSRSRSAKLRVAQRYIKQQQLYKKES